MNLRLRTILPFLLPFSLLAQQQSPTPPNASAPATLQLDVTVNGHSGRSITGLTQSNFTVTDNGAPQQILNFRAVQAPSTDPPVQVILVVDTVNTGFIRIAYERDQISQFLRKSGPTLPYPLSFVFVSDTGTEMQRVPSRSTAALLDELNKQVIALRTIGRHTGFEGASERFQISLKALNQIANVEQSIPGRKLLIWISPGWPYLSGPRVNISARDRNWLFSGVVGLSTAFERARITLYSVDPLGVEGSMLRSNYYQAFLDNVTSSKEIQSGNLSLQVLARHSGGKVLNAGNDIAGEIATCIDDASAFYVLTLPRASSDSADNFHAIQIKLPDTSLKARTVNGYYAQPTGPLPGDPR